ncbi:amino acid adenylation domain-containing protein [Fulvivirga ulvae]|uniref:non-ribosomal peptide synthetase n=1 Tax=Fulvivirga ulvae TaxID=2904245 RepID=UPI001F40F966|nr:non-ribosomal peptide synthetase [Fulvivirga ulvae]UII33626.1 amino acid adenylation domain-containing protein [Fulvivirga ulvae]
MPEKIKRSNVQDIVELNMTQKGILFQYLEKDDLSIYNIQLSLDILGEFNPKIFENACRRVQQNQEALRSVFRWEAVKNPVQIILKECPLEFSITDICHLDEQGKEEMIRAFCTDELSKRFDLSVTPFKIRILKSEADHYILNIIHHHILYDGWSTGVLVKALFDTYYELLTVSTPAFNTPIQLRTILKGLQGKKNLVMEQAYWKRILEDYKPKNIWQNNNNYNVTPTPEYIRLTVSKEGLDVQRYASIYGLVPSSVFYAGYINLMHRLSGDTDVLFGTVVSSRDLNISGADQVIGNFVNTLPFRHNHQVTESFEQQIRRVDKQLAELTDFSQSSYLEIRKMLDLQPGDSLFDSLLIIQNYPLHDLMVGENCEVRLREVYETTELPLVVNVFMREHVALEFIGNATFFTKQQLQQLADAYLEIITEMCASPEQTPEILARLDYMETGLNTVVRGNGGNLGSSLAFSPEIKAVDQSVLSELKNVWCEVLGIEDLNSNDNVFYKGADSILLIQVSSRLKRLGYKLPVKTIMKFPTLEGMATKIQADIAEVVLQDIQGEFSLLPVQESFFNLQQVELSHYNQSVSLYFKEGLSKEVLDTVVSELVGHHDAFRIRFRAEGNSFAPGYTNNTAHVKIEEFTLDSNVVSQTLLDELQRSLDIAEGPVCKIGLFHYQRSSRVLIIMHHLITDGVSWRILLEDLSTLLRQHQRGEKLALPEKSQSLKLWSEGLKKYLETDQYKKTREYWASFAQQEFTNIPLDNDDGNNKVADQKEISFYIDATYTSRLLKEAHEAFGTQINDLLLTALAWTVQKKYGLNQLYTMLEGHGREAIAEQTDISRTLGWFTSIFPVCLSVPEGSPGTQIKSLKEQLRSVPNKGFDYLPGVFLDPSFKKPAIVPRMKFNYLGQFDPVDSYGIFEIADIDNGREQSPEHYREVAIDIWAMVINGQLKVTLTHSIEQISTPQIVEFASLLQVSLQEVTDYCCDYMEKELTSSDLSYAFLNQNQIESLENEHDIEDIYPLSGMQQGILFETLLNPNSAIYFEQKTMMLEGELQVFAVQESLELLLQQHGILRTLFIREGYDQPLQVLLKSKPLTFEFKDVTNEVDGVGEDALLEASRQEQRQRPFNLEAGDTFRVQLYKTATARYHLIWNYHHILMDGWCMGLLWNDFKNIYETLIAEKKYELRPVKQYAEYIEWLQNQNREAARARWKTYLSGVSQATSLIGYKVKRGNNTAYSHISRTFDKDRSNQLNVFARQLNTTPFRIIQAAWGLLLQKYTGLDDVVFGSVVSGRPEDIQDIESMIGLFINTLPIRYSKFAGDTFKSVVRRLEEEQIEMTDVQYLSLSEVQSQTMLGRALFDHILVFENYPLSDTFIGSSLGMTSVQDVHVFEQTHYDLVLVINPGEQLRFHANFNSDAYPTQLIDNLLTHFSRIVYAIMETPELPVNSWSLATQAEETGLLQHLNHENCQWPEGDNVIDLLEKQIEKTPENTALVLEGKRMSYRELQSRSEQVATYLQSKGITAGEIVGVYLDRSLDYIVAMLGILKAGGVYLPLDIDYPESRTLYMLKDSNAKWVITDQTNAFSNLPIEICTPVEIFESKGTYRPLEFLDPQSICYIIYTSGTTGNPKGVMVSHSNVVRLFQNSEFQFDFNQDDIWTMFHSPCFDFSIWEIFGALFFGGSVVIIPKMIARDPRLYLKLLKTERVTVLNQTPSAFYNIVIRELESPSADLALRYVIFGGEALSPGKLSGWKAKYPDVRLINMFGITETTVHVTYKEIGSYEIENNISNIGHPIPTLSVYILDENMKPQPHGVVGEMYVGGAGVTKGYLGKEGLTRQRFVDNPFVPEQKLYKTGDLARLLLNGEIEYRGRVDFQVQLRGFRIELGEIESRIKGYKTISEAVVVMKEDEEEKFLVGYYVSGEKINVVEIRHFLSQQMAEYMVPSYFVRIEELPLTPNGKIDKQALPAPDFEEVDERSLAKNEIEQMLVDIWANVLGLHTSRIGIHTNFFDLGGDSMKLVKMVDQIALQMNVKITVADAFTYPVISLLSKFLSEGKKEQSTSDSNDLDQITETMDLLSRL